MIRRYLRPWLIIGALLALTLWAFVADRGVLMLLGAAAFSITFLAYLASEESKR